MKVTKLQKQAGFTVIELIMVIVILGVLSAFALPRFADLGGDARASSMNGLAGAVRSAANIAHAKWLADAENAGTVDLDGAPGIVMTDGYPSAAGIVTAAQISATDYDFTAPAAGDASVTFNIDGATDDATCFVTYTVANGAVTSDTDGC